MRNYLSEYRRGRRPRCPATNVTMPSLPKGGGTALAVGGFIIQCRCFIEKRHTFLSSHIVGVDTAFPHGRGGNRRLTERGYTSTRKRDVNQLK